MCNGVEHKNVGCVICCSILDTLKPLSHFTLSRYCSHFNFCQLDEDFLTPGYFEDYYDYGNEDSNLIVFPEDETSTFVPRPDNDDGPITGDPSLYTSTVTAWQAVTVLIL